MRTITVEEFMKFNPCYSEEKIRKIAGKKKNWTVLDILQLEGVPATDKFWAVLREELIDKEILHEFACRCAEQALALIDEKDERSLAAIAAKRKWIRGEITDKELAAAQDAAYAAWAVVKYVWANSAASRADYAAASHAANAAVWASASIADWAANWAANCAADCAADCAAYVAANSAARGAAYAATKKEQINMLIELLEEKEHSAKDE